MTGERLGLGKLPSCATEVSTAASLDGIDDRFLRAGGTANWRSSPWIGGVGTMLSIEVCECEMPDAEHWVSIMVGRRLEGVVCRPWLDVGRFEAIS